MFQVHTAASPHSAMLDVKSADLSQGVAFLSDESMEQMQELAEITSLPKMPTVLNPESFKGNLTKGGRSKALSKHLRRPILLL